MTKIQIGWLFGVVLAVAACDGAPDYFVEGGDAGVDHDQIVQDEPDVTISVPRRETRNERDEEMEPASPAPASIVVVETPAPASVVVESEPASPASESEIVVVTAEESSVAPAPAVTVMVEAAPAPTVIINMPETTSNDEVIGCNSDDECSEGRICENRECVTETCTPGDTRTCYLASGVRGERPCASTGIWGMCREVVSANPESETTPAPAPTTIVTVIVPSPAPPATPAEPPPPVVVPASECQIRCEGRGASCGFSEASRNLFCAEFCDVYSLTDDQVECLLDLPCAALPDLLDAELRENLVEECDASDAVNPSDDLPRSLPGDPQLPLAECLERCIDEFATCDDLVEDEVDFICSALCTMFDPRESELSCMENAIPASCDIDSPEMENALLCFDEYRETYVDTTDPEPEPEPDPTPTNLADTCSIQVESKDDMPTFKLNYEEHQEGGMYWENVWCEGDERLRNCSIPSANIRSEIDFWFQTGLQGPGSWSPGNDEDTDEWSAFHLVTVTCTKDGVGYSPDVEMKEYSDGAVRFTFWTDGTRLPNVSDPNADSDGDAVPNSLDCNDTNASIRPPLSGETWDNEICGNNIDENCDGLIDACAP